MNLNIPDKKYFKIGEASQIAGLEPHVLRFWESEFKTLSPKKDSGRQRLYTQQDLALIFEIKKLLYDENFTISGARKRLGKKSSLNMESKPEKNNSHPPDVRKSLKGIISELNDIKKILAKNR